MTKTLTINDREYSNIHKETQLERYIYCYTEKINDLRVKNDSLKIIYPTKNISSPIDYISSNNFKDDKYVLFKKIFKDYKKHSHKSFNRQFGNINVEKSFNDNSDDFFNALNEILDILNDMKTFGFNTYSSNFQIEDMRRDLYKIINLKSSDINYYYLLYEYNQKIIEFVNSIHLLERIDVDYLDSTIKHKYYDLNANKWILKIKFDKQINENKINEIFENDTSIY